MKNMKLVGAIITGLLVMAVGFSGIFSVQVEDRVAYANTTTQDN